MEDVLRWTLFIVGTCAIAGVLIHGLWVSRKATSKDKRGAKVDRQRRDGLHTPASSEPRFSPFDEDFEQNDTQADKSDFDDFGVGPVRVVSSNHSLETNTPSEEQSDDDSHYGSESSDDVDKEQDVEEGDTLPADFDPLIEPASAPPPKPVTPPGKVYASVVTQPKPEYAAQANHYTQAGARKVKDVPEPPTFLLKSGQQNDGVQKAPTDESLPQPAVSPTTSDGNVGGRQIDSDVTNKVMHSRKNEVANRKRREPKFTEDQLNIDFDEQQADNNEGPAQPQKSEAKPQATEQPQEVLVLNVKTADDAPIHGASLLPMLLTLGFKFGDQDIFHRHVNANGKGPVLFSLANMFKPGVFDIDHLENFTTQGVTLFMILPIEGDPHQVFNMMHNATRKIADEFNGQILDGRRSMLTKQGLQQYVERIREFERKRMIRR